MSKRTVKFIGPRVLLSEGFYRPFQDTGTIYRVGDRWAYARPEAGLFLPLAANENDAKVAAAKLLEAEIVGAE